MIYAKPGDAFEARVQGFPAGQAGVVGVQILDDSGDVAVARTTDGIQESPAGSGSYIATLVAPPAGGYSVFWDTGVISPSTTAAEELVVNDVGQPAPPPVPVDYTPTVSQVAKLIMSRTRNSNGQLLGTFTADTEPTDTDVDALIATAQAEVEDVVGNNIPEELWDDVSTPIAYLAAANVELSFFSEQVNTGRSIYPQLMDRYKESLADVKAQLTAMEESGSDEPTNQTANRASWAFPAADGRVTLSNNKAWG